MSDEIEETDDDEIQSAREMWAQHEITLGQAKEARKETVSALQKLTLSCASSSDPNIARLHGLYMGWKHALGVFDTAMKKKTMVQLP